MTVTTIGALLGARARAQPFAPALLAPDRDSLDYGSLGRAVHDLADDLRRAGIGAQDRVGIVLPNGPEMAVAFLGVAACAAAAPLNPAYTAQELDWFLARIGACGLIVQAGADSPAVAAAQARGIRVLALAPDGGRAGACRVVEARSLSETPDPERSPAPGDTALILHTSGTTGRPKIVALTHRQLCASAANTADALALDASDRCLNVMPLFHVHGLVAALLASLHAGGSVVCAPGCLAPRFFGWVDALAPTWYTAVPAMHRAIAAQAHRHAAVLDRHRLRFARSSSSPLPPSLLAELESRLGVAVIEAYGMTEASHQIASNPLPPRLRLPGSVGVAAGPQVAVLRDGRPVSEPGVEGEVVIRGETVIDAYDQPGPPGDSFLEGWFRTGDLGRLDGEGHLFLTGRLKEVINRGGETIAPREIDDALMEHPAVAEALAFPVADPRLGEEVAAAVVLRPGREVGPGELRDFAANRLAAFKVPGRVVFVDAIPAGVTGKPRRSELACTLSLGADEAPALDAGEPEARPRTSLEERLAGLWAEVLEVDEVGVDQHFLDLGGDSLLAMRLVAAIIDRFELELSPRDLFDAPTVARQAAIVGPQLEAGARLG